jgi:uncharacterized protein
VEPGYSTRAWATDKYAAHIARIENVEIVRRSLEAFARGDFDTAFAAYDPESVWCTAADEPDQRTYRGIEELRSFAESLDELWEDRFAEVMEFEDFIDRGDWVVVPWTARLHGRSSGIAVDVNETYAVQLRDGRIVRVDEYRHTHDALARVTGEEAR